MIKELKEQGVEDLAERAHGQPAVCAITLRTGPWTLLMPRPPLTRRAPLSPTGGRGRTEEDSPEVTADMQHCSINWPGSNAHRAARPGDPGLRPRARTGVASADLVFGRHRAEKLHWPTDPATERSETRPSALPLPASVS